MPDEAAPIAAQMTGAEPVMCPLGVGESGSTVQVRSGTLTSPSGRAVSAALVTTGIGTVAAASASTWAISALRPRVVVSVGSAGGLAEDIQVGTVVVGERFAYSIADATAFGYAPSQVPGAPQFFTNRPARGKGAGGGEVNDGAGQGANDGASTPSEPGPSPAAQIVQLLTEQSIPARSGLMLAGDAFVVASNAAPMREKHPDALTADMETTAHAHVADRFGLPFFAVRAVSDLCSPRADEEFHIGLDVAAEASATALMAALDVITAH